MSNASFNTMTSPELAAAYNEMSKRADEKFSREPKFKPVKKFSTRTEGITRCGQLATMLSENNEEATRGLFDEIVTFVRTALGNPYPKADKTPAVEQQDTTQAAGSPSTEPKEEPEMARATAKKGKKAAKSSARKKVAAGAATKKGAKKAEAGGARRPRSEFETMRILSVSDDAKRREGTRAHDVFTKMTGWQKRNPGKPISELFKATDYNSTDLAHDMKKGHIKVSKL